MTSIRPGTLEARVVDARAGVTSRWTMPVLRVGMALFLLAWGLDKLLAVQGSQRIFDRFYRLSAGPSLVQAAGVAEIVIMAVSVALVLDAEATRRTWRRTTEEIE